MTEMMEPAGKPPARPMRNAVWAKKRFLDNLAEHYDDARACRASGLTWPQICAHRHLDPDFAAKWQTVIDAGYDRIETMLLRCAGAGGAGGAGETDLALARELLRHRAALRGPVRAGAGAAKGEAKPLDRAALIKSIMGKSGARRAAAAARKKEANQDEQATATARTCAARDDLADRPAGAGRAGAPAEPAKRRRPRRIRSLLG